MAPNLTAIAHEFGFDDDERDTYLGGYVSTAFFVVGGCASLVFGVSSGSACVEGVRPEHALEVFFYIGFLRVEKEIQRTTNFSANPAGVLRSLNTSFLPQLEDAEA